MRQTRLVQPSPQQHPVSQQSTAELGRTGMILSRVGLGTWAQGGGGWAAGWGPQDDRESMAAIRAAVEAGINWIDTAPAYGHGHAEEVVGQVMAEMAEGDRPYVFTKLGRRWDPADPMAPLRTALTADSIQGEVEDSLRRLRTERIDLLQVHWPADDGTAIEEYWGALVRLREQGKIRAAGLSNHNVAQLAEAEQVGHVDSLQPPFSMIRRDAAAAEIGWCAAHATGVIVYSPLQAGLLSGAMTAQRVAAMPADDWRSRNAEFAGDRFDRNLDLARRLLPVARRHGTTQSAVAIAWTLAWPGVTGAIVGARRPEQLRDWIAAASLRLGDADLDELAAAITDTGAGTGPARP
jgi:aryl-alcohol dehydrogenase-like predicted oxidoreductase